MDMKTLDSAPGWFVHNTVESVIAKRVVQRLNDDI